MSSLASMVATVCFVEMDWGVAKVWVSAPLEADANARLTTEQTAAEWRASLRRLRPRLACFRGASVISGEMRPERRAGVKRSRFTRRLRGEFPVGGSTGRSVAVLVYLLYQY